MTLSSAQSKKRGKSWQSTDMLIAILVLLPSIIAVGLFIYTAMGWTFYISTVKWNSQIRDFTFVGLRNWQRLYSDSRFWIDLRNLVYYAAGFMTQCIVFGFILATLLDQKIKGEIYVKFFENKKGKM